MTIFPVADGIYRGSRPETEADFQILKDKGIKTLINLQGYEDKTTAFELIIKNHLINYDIEQTAIFPPSAQHTKMVQSILNDSFYYPIFIHCHQGVDRTGFEIAKYRISKGMSKENAIIEMKTLGLHKWFYWWPSYL